jgi:hypothetical protein
VTLTSIPESYRGYTQWAVSDAAGTIIANLNYGSSRLDVAAALAAGVTFDLQKFNYSYSRDYWTSHATLTNTETWNFTAGGTGNDLLIARGATATIRGSGGTDTFFVDWSGATEGIVWSNDPTHDQVIHGITIGGVERLLLTTGSGNDVITNTAVGATDDQIVTGNGNDTISGGQGNDILTGGFGLDTAIFSGARAGYTLTKSGASFIVTDTNVANGDNGTDTLFGIERLQFADVEVGVASDPGMRIGHVAYPTNWLAYYTVGDFNSDGKTDIWWKTQAGATAVWTISNGNTWDPAAMHSPFTGWTTVDNNGDGKADVAFEHTAAGGTIQWDNAEQTISAPSIGTDHGWAMF